MRIPSKWIKRKIRVIDRELGIFKESQDRFHIVIFNEKPQQILRFGPMSKKQLEGLQTTITKLLNNEE